MNKAWIFAAFVMVAGSAQAQSQKQISRDLFCQDVGLTAYQSLADFRHGISIDTSMQRVDGWICTEDTAQVCDISRGMLRNSVKMSYKIGNGLHVMEMSPEQFLQFNDINQTKAVSTCVEAARQAG